ncbi:hypothetical protein [Streptomyces lavendofoliae]|uniref:hypothetical protein n=1 Tax=Streptomyces lavendofoliae TaxID=67314 RepID=UPI003D8CD6E4
MLTDRTKHSVRDAKINYRRDPEICPVRAWVAYRQRLTAEADPRWSAPDAPAFVGIDRWGHVAGGMVPDSVTRAVKRISTRAGVELEWTGHSLRIGRSMNRYFQRVDGWDDNSSADLT